MRPTGTAAASARLGFDSVGLPDRALDLTLAGDSASAVVEIAADGEVISLETTLRYRSLPGALRVIVPASTDAGNAA